MLWQDPAGGPAAGSVALFDHYPDRWAERLFCAAAIATGSACLIRFVTGPNPFVTHTLILVAAVLDAGIVFLQLSWWKRALRDA